MASVSRLVTAGLRRQLCGLQSVSAARVLQQHIRSESSDATALETRPTVRKFDPVVRQNLTGEIYYDDTYYYEEIKCDLNPEC